MAHYTVSRHDAPGGTHWDLFLEDGDALRTWRLSAPPETIEALNAVACEALAAHRKTYLDFEGEVSGGRGTVSLHSQGTYTLDGDRLHLEGGVSDGEYRFEAEGKVLRAVYCQGPR